MQAKGMTIIADKLNNMRFLSHFRSVHRGAYFTEIKTTTIRKLLPESWGFVCPVHTPDGTPCGLLNHISLSCCPTTRPAFHPDKHFSIEMACIEFGMTSIVNNLSNVYTKKQYYLVALDGKLVGYVEKILAKNMCSGLRELKVSQNPKMLIPESLEIALLEDSEVEDLNVLFPGVFLATNEARFLRPVKNLRLNKIEWISPFEQIHLSIACTENDIRDDTDYQEVSPADILSILPSNIPFLNHNQSPRNMY